jgi:hypothetical protein
MDDHAGPARMDCKRSWDGRLRIFQITEKIQIINSWSSTNKSLRSSMVEWSVRWACDRGSYTPVSMASHRMGDQNLLSQASPCSVLRKAR